MMKIIIAHLIALFLSPIVGAIISTLSLLILLPFARHNILMQRFSFFLLGVISGFVALYFGTIVFGWFNIEPTASLFIVMILAFVLNDINRIRTRPDFDNEVMHLFGDIVGVYLGAHFWIWNLDTNALPLPFLLVSLIVFLLIRILRAGNVKFWKLVNKHPDEAYTLFINQSAWLVLEEINKETQIDRNKFDGPFRFYLPSEDKWFLIFGKIDEYKTSQEVFVKNYD